MKYLDQIKDVERRARQIRLPMAALLRHAGVAPQTWWRWKSQRGSPMMATFEAAMEKFGERLAAEEAAIREKVTG
jgi:DNA-binding phage protein